LVRKPAVLDSMNRVGFLGLAIVAGFAQPGLAETSPNLLLNGDGSIGHCTTDRSAATTVPGWTVTEGSPALLCSTGARIPPGKSAIWGGPYGGSVLTQTVDLPQGSGIAYTLSGRFGTDDRKGRATLSAEFLDGAGQSSATAELSGKTTEIHGSLPAATRQARLTLRFAGKGGIAGDLSLTLSVPATPTTLALPKAEVPPFDHVFIVMMENTDYAQVAGNAADAPFINSLIRQGTLLRNYQANYHPSDQNYLAIAGGDAFVKGPQYFPHIRLTAPNIADRIEAAGKDWKSYEQGMGTPCNTTTKFDKYFEPDEAPFINFTDIAGDKARCRAHLVDIAQLAIDLERTETTPAFAWIAADDYYDGEASGNNGYAAGGGSPKSLRVQDGWLKETLTPLLASPAWKNERSLLILTWDESETTHGNHIATVLVGSWALVRAGAASDLHYDHYSTARTIEAALSLQPLTENDEYAQPINDAFVQAPR